MRLIDADALYDTFERTPWMDNADRDIAEEVAENAPTVAEDNNVPVKQPDPITGLMPCGCGGKAYMADWSMNGAHLYSVHCLDCNTQTDHCESREKAKTRWNTAMGWKGGAE